MIGRSVVFLDRPPGSALKIDQGWSPFQPYSSDGVYFQLADTCGRSLVGFASSSLEV